MFDVGRVCVKLAGRDAGKRCVIVEKIDALYVLVDGETRRRKVNTSHLIPTEMTITIAKGADHGAIVEAVAKAGLKPRNTKPRPATKRPRIKRSVKKRMTAKKTAKATQTKAAPKADAKSDSESKKHVKKSDTPEHALHLEKQE